MKFGFVFTNYNNSGFTREAVRSIAENPGWDPSCVVVVDNRSEPADVEALRRIQADYPGIRLILNAENVGYFRGLNLGIEHLRREHPDVEHVVVGNNDLEFPPGFLDVLVRHRAVLDAHAVVSPDLVTLDGVHQNPHVADTISRKRELVYDLYYANYWLALLIRFVARATRRVTERKDYDAHGVAREIYQGYGACYILGPRFFREFGTLWAPTFLMGEEYFLSRQLEEKGQKVYYEPAILVRHHDHATMGKVPSRKMWEIARDAHKVYRQYVKVLP